jgi:hypothetical protein
MSELELIKKENLRLKEAIKKKIFGKENAFLVRKDFYNELISSPSKKSYIKSSADLEDNLINNASSLINCLKDNIGFRLITVKILQTICIDKNLKNFNHIFYGYNKAIIEFSGQDGYSILLIEDPFNSNNNYKNFFMKIKNKKKQMEKLYKKLIENKINNYEEYIKTQNLNLCLQKL